MCGGGFGAFPFWVVCGGSGLGAFPFLIYLQVGVMDAVLSLKRSLPVNYGACIICQQDKHGEPL